MNRYKRRRERREGSQGGKEEAEEKQTMRETQGGLAPAPSRRSHFVKDRVPLGGFDVGAKVLI